MKAPARALAAVCTLSAATVLCAGCVGKSLIPGAAARGEVFIQPAEVRGADPFTDSTVWSTAQSAPVTRPAQPTAYESDTTWRLIMADRTLIDIENKNMWIERRIGDDGRQDIDVRPPQARVQPPQVDVRPPGADAESGAPERFGTSSQEPGPVASSLPPLERADPSESGARAHEQNLSVERPPVDCAMPSVTVTAAPMARDETPAPGDAPAEGGDRRADCPTASIAAAVTSPPALSGAATPFARPTVSSGPSAPVAPDGGRPISGDTSMESPLFDSPADALGH
ncbi:hypothetical protein [Streptomyces chiangmaiensis]|uniref:Secreted protein n=1 Tax=Streptomyces chiangmaiensis TaxID=766497 RepID=A0ABU7FH45_9ACTN|nr:hypothetical protein [Streptomyces chiangmaiensis]MED7823378.1 hypothetical protein [Streptomyces chiangmaiensis]